MSEPSVPGISIGHNGFCAFAAFVKERRIPLNGDEVIFEVRKAHAKRFGDFGGDDRTFFEKQESGDGIAAWSREVFGGDRFGERVDLEHEIIFDERWVWFVERGFDLGEHIVERRSRLRLERRVTTQTARECAELIPRSAKGDADANCDNAEVENFRAHGGNGFFEIRQTHDERRYRILDELR